MEPTESKKDLLLNDRYFHLTTKGVYSQIVGDDEESDTTKELYKEIADFFTENKALPHVEFVKQFKEWELYPIIELYREKAKEKSIEIIKWVAIIFLALIVLGLIVDTINMNKIISSFSSLGNYHIPTE